MPEIIAIPLTHGLVALIDAEDYKLVSKHKWHAKICATRPGLIYAATNETQNGKQRTIRLHRLLLNIIDPKIFVDHINHNGLDNRKENLRICTNTQNCRNAKKRLANGASKFKGVSWSKRCNKFHAAIQINKQYKHIGYFTSELEAAKAYDKVAKTYFGEFAYLNFAPPETPHNAVVK